MAENNFYNNLFNDIRMERYIELHSDKLVIKSDEDPLNYWIGRLNRDELRDEKKNYLKFYDYVLKELLGYATEDIEYEDNIGDEGHPVEFTLKKDGTSYAIIEVKGTTYKDLTKRKPPHQSPVEQATNYASAKKETEWAIVTNYDEFRLFNPISRENYISFRFRDLSDENLLKKFLLVFGKYSLIEQKIPKKLLDETRVIERDLEDGFYQLYSETRAMLIKELEYSSDNIDRIEAIRLAQLILNRYIFLCFAEDLRLIEEETTTEILMTPIEHKFLMGNTMMTRLNELFAYANLGNEFKGIRGFNGGLFAEDLSNLKIRDTVEDYSFFKGCRTKWGFDDKYDDIINSLDVYKDILNPIYINLLIISSFRFDKELDVNILGHIFENSIGDIEELKEDDTEQRRQDGVYYTPEYITDFICRNTIIPYLSISGKAKTVHELLTEYESNNSLDELDSKLKNIKIVDPACGSGSILNKAVDILFEIHEELHNSKYAGDQSLNPYMDSLEKRKEIISNNIYGVDLNGESIEITKLSLFLKLATNVGTNDEFKLPDLNKNIKCGNSLISDETLDDKAFNWKEKFKDVFENGGFDIIVGNPPYIKENVNREAFDGLRDSPYYQGKMDIWTFFGCMSLDLLKQNGLVAFIAPNNWITNAGASKFRKKVSDDAELLVFRNFGNYKVFKGIGIQTMIYIMKKNNEKSEYFIDYSIFKKDNVEDTDEVIDFLYSTETNDNMAHFKSYYNRNENKNSYLNFIDEYELAVINKISNNENTVYLKNNDISQGIVSPQDFLNEKNANKLDLPINSGVFVLSEDEKNNLNLDNNELEIIKPYFTSTEIKQYITLRNNKYWIIYTKSDINDKIEQYPHIKKHLDVFSSIITSSNKPYGLHRARNEDIFKGEKIIVTRKCLTPTFSYANMDTYVAQTFNIIKTERFDLKIVLGILNSTLIKFWLKNKGKMQGNNYQLDKEPLKKIPIKYEENNLTLSIKAIVENILEHYQNFYEETNNFNKWLLRTISSDLNPVFEYYDLSIDEFLIELEKQGIDTRPRDIQELIETEFNKSVEIIKPLLRELKEFENQVNKIVYELYGISSEEIELIEKNLNN